MTPRKRSKPRKPKPVSASVQWLLERIRRETELFQAIHDALRKARKARRKP